MNKTIAVFGTIFVTFVIISCATMFTKVPAGYVGVKVNMLGGNKGVDAQVVTPGLHWLSVNENLYLFPTYTQNVVWTADAVEGSPNDESIAFNDVDGLTISGDFGLTYHIDPERVSAIFAKYRRGIDEITDVFARNAVRDVVVSVASGLHAEEIYGSGKEAFMLTVNQRVKERLADDGILVDDVYLIGSFRMPQSVIAAIDAKIAAIQLTQQRNNEVARTEAEANMAIAAARGRAESALIEARAEAESNRIIAESLTPALVNYQAIAKWNGQLPTVTSGSVPMLNLGQLNK